MIRLTLHFNVLLITILLALLTIPLTLASHEKKNDEINNKQNINNNSDSNSLTQKIFNIEIKQQKVVGKSKTIRITQGDNVSIIWQSDEAAKLHLHGYDIEFDISASEAKTLHFIATASGRFAITSHGFSNKIGHGHEALLYLEVYPD